MSAVTIHAPAKINLALHVTGQREDGYHLLDTLVAFTEAGDRITISASAEDEFLLSGPFAAGLTAAGDNLVVRARDGFRGLLGAGQSCPPVRIKLEKNLPIASGIGGGSADAAATLKGLLRFWKAEAEPEALQALALSLGADVPMCLLSRPLIARGIGEEIWPVDLPSLPILLVNPLLPISTPQIFRRLAEKNNSPLPAGLADLSADTLARIAPLRNDLQPPAESLEPVVAEICAALSEAGAVVSRMSGSGATCFGLFADEDACRRAGDLFRTSHPGWFIAATRTLP
jgi:4-diphosphocytidyl-2-C-methyl-D-erythritol kinase